MTKRLFSRALKDGLIGAAGSMLALSAAPTSAQTCADHGIPVNGYPKWEERAMLVLTNACRIAPVPYRDTYITSSPSILQPTKYPAVPPLQWNLALSQSSRAQAFDLANTPGCGFMHNSCNGTAWDVRVRSYYTNSASIGENLAAGYQDPLTCTNGLLIDAVGTAAAPDGSGNDGHRANIMYSGFTQTGCGFASGPNPYGRYWAEDFGRPQGTTTICSPIAAGSHIIQSGQVVFLVNYFDTGNISPQSAQVFINGTATALAVHLGTAAKGTYKAQVTAGTACRSYHFEFRNPAGTLFRYPTRGELRTFKEGSCGEDYLAATTPPPPCVADFDASGAATVDDIFLFLNAWFAGLPTANFDGVNGVTIDDIFGYLNAWFRGCV